MYQVTVRLVTCDANHKTDIQEQHYAKRPLYLPAQLTGRTDWYTADPATGLRTPFAVEVRFSEEDDPRWVRWIALSWDLDIPDEREDVVAMLQDHEASEGVDPVATATLTLRRPRNDITVALAKKQGHRPAAQPDWRVLDAVDEKGHPVALTTQEHYQLCRRAEAGEDETGVKP